MSLRSFALVFGVVFILIGLLGFIPGVTTDEGLLLGIFEVSPLHNVIHLVSGLAALLGYKSNAYARMYFQIFGVVYAVVAVTGLVQGSTVLGLIDVNAADNVLHVVIAVAALGLGFGTKKPEAVSQQQPQQ